VLVESHVPPLEVPWVVSIITVGELQAGVLLARDPTVQAQRLQRLSAVLAEAPIIAIDTPTASRYGQLRAATGKQPANDLWIAATATRARLHALITADERLASLPLIRAALVA
jgi:predicted nucleic acid-binding protein